jgi:hypothetical protein
VRYKDYTIKKVLVNNGSTLNVLPKHILDEMVVGSMHMLPSTMTVRTYNGSWVIEIEFFIGLQMFLITF